MLSPKKTKFRKSFRMRGHVSGVATKGTSLVYGSSGLKATQAGEITSRQIESARKTMARFTKRGGRVWIRIFPDKQITRKAAEVPMGGGKGEPEFFCAQVKAGTVLFEIDGLPEKQAKEAITLASHKLPIQSRYFTKDII
ncbi:MAG: 50S ribosomal protein L16 [Candidatus Peregrinibacteria bacterium]|nr:50S ribosomal protein L16 [Candidatus Peregrinibacteria bacterium]